MDKQNRGSGRRWSRKKTLGLVAVLLAGALVAPLWSTRMEAPQYRNEEALRVTVYAGHVSGDIEEINTLNQYVGVHLPLDTPELKAAPFVLSGLLIVALIAVALPQSRLRAGAMLLLASLTIAGGVGAGLLQYRLYQMGHVRDRAIMEGVPDFTPPILGTAKIANFTATMSLGLGGWAYLTAVVLTGFAVFAESSAQEVVDATGTHDRTAPSGA